LFSGGGAEGVMKGFHELRVYLFLLRTCFITTTWYV
jgi:hypothetical protein